jgi:CRP-like cAMP-binding protein
VVGERALLEHGRRTSTLQAATACRVAVVDAEQVEPALLAELAIHHRREGG